MIKSVHRQLQTPVSGLNRSLQPWCALIRNPYSITHSTCLYAVNNVVVSTSASVSPPSSTSSEVAPSIKSQSTPDPPAKSGNPLSTWFSPSQAEQNRQSKAAQGNKSTTSIAEKSGSSSMFGSTWGASDSFWGSYFGSPGSSDQGGAGGEGKDKCSSSGEGAKEAPKPTSMARGVGARKLKSQISSSNKTQSNEQRKKMTSPRLTSPPKSSSTPLPQPKEKEKSEDTRLENSSGMESASSLSKPEQNVATPKSSSKPQSTGKTLVKASESEKGEVGSPKSDTEVKAKKPNSQNLKKSRATPEPSEAIKNLKDDAAILEATDTGSTAAKDNTLTVVTETASTQEETNKQPDTSSTPLYTEDLKTKDVKLMKKSSSLESQFSPTNTAHNVIELQQKDTTQVPLQRENNDSHLVVHHEAEHDSTGTWQTTVEQAPFSDKELETKTENNSNSESKSTEQDRKITSSASDQPHNIIIVENNEVDTKIAETKDSTSTAAVQQLQAPSGDQQTSEPDRGQSPTSVAIQDKEEGEPVDDKQKDEYTSPQKKATAKESMEHSDIDRLKKVLGSMLHIHVYVHVLCMCLCIRCSCNLTPLL